MTHGADTFKESVYRTVRCATRTFRSDLDAGSLHSQGLESDRNLLLRCRPTGPSERAGQEQEARRRRRRETAPDSPLQPLPLRPRPRPTCPHPRSARLPPDCPSPDETSVKDLQSRARISPDAGTANQPSNTNHVGSRRAGLGVFGLLRA